ncbi:MAG: transcription antitermination factor NusB [Lachnospiraceae bacterium]|jgi:N utilization substance protein B|nr:transcription antitermination factor NusB [Lachnospiraceae bacterium]MCI1327405.1 transcription antitermination factor NusB [Lachnospiraceae bacterium]
MKRSEIRETIFILLFMSQFYDKNGTEEQRKLYLEGMNDGRLAEIQGVMPTDEDTAYITGKLDRILEREDEIDAMLDRISEGWRTRRMAGTDRCVLRLAVYEICFDEEIPTGVAINEAVELAKKYGGDHSASFVNGILGKVAEENQN